MRIKVIIAGFTGRMGSAALDMVKKDEELELVALLSPTAEVDELDGVPAILNRGPHAECRTL